MCLNPPTPKVQLESARELASYARELGADVDLLFAWIDVHLGRVKEARVALDSHLQRHPDFHWDWGVEAMILAGSGQKEVAHDWYLATRESMANLEQSNNRSGAITMAEWARTQGWESDWPPADWTETDKHALLLSILKRRPSSPHAHYLLGAWYARQGRWQEAREAYEKSVALGPRDSLAVECRFHRLALGGALLQVGDTIAYRELCRETMQPAMTEGFYQWAARDVALLCCVFDNSGVDIPDVRQMCDKAVQRSNAHWQDIIWVKGMLAYRSGKWREAIDALQGWEGGSELGIVAQYFCAMAYHREGNQLEAQKRLKRAEERAAMIVPSFDGPPTDWYETSMIWSLLQPIRREAHALIDEPAAVKTKDESSQPSSEKAK